MGTVCLNDGRVEVVKEIFIGADVRVEGLMEGRRGSAAVVVSFIDGRGAVCLLLTAVAVRVGVAWVCLGWMVVGEVSVSWIVMGRAYVGWIVVAGVFVLGVPGSLVLISHVVVSIARLRHLFTI